MKKEIARREFLKLKIRGDSYTECKAILEQKMGTWPVLSL